VTARSNKERGIILTLLLLSGAYLALVYFPRNLDSRVIGFVGSDDGSRFTVQTVYPDSPAARAGIQTGDVVRAMNGIATDQWRRWYKSNVGRYLKERLNFRDRQIAVEVDRDGSRMDLRLSTRALTVHETARFFGVRTFLIVIIMALVVYILANRTKDRAAFLICLCFCFTIPWLASDEPFWPSFYSPLVRSVEFPLIYLVDILEAVSLQMAVAALVHIALVFPQEHYLKRRFPWLPTAVYVLSFSIPAIAMLFAPGGFLERITELYAARLRINTALMIFVTWLIFSGYRQCRIPFLREKVRWIFVSMAIVAVIHLTLWNIPILLTGVPLVGNYSWMLVPLALLPLSMTLSITNHELFGIRGIVRGRISLLDTRLQREKNMVVTRDQRIQALEDEINQLKSSLDEYTVQESPTEEVPLSDPLARLEAKYPEIKSIREQRLLGVSPLWRDIFEQTVLAAQGNAPVLIVGESGTGKTDVAWAIHHIGERRDRGYKEISCAQFEHADPAFALGRLFGIGTGHGLPNAPREGRRGLLEECDGGTLFLDDFDRLPLNVQDLLLYPLEGKPFEPGVGSGPPRSVSIKFIFATNRDPQRLVESGEMRGDVLARMRRRIDIPPLRKRPEDIPQLVEHFIRIIGEEIGHAITLVSPRSMTLLCRYPFAAGNARELKAELEKAVGRAMLENDTVLRAGYLSEQLRGGDTATGDSDLQSSPKSRSIDAMRNAPAAPNDIAAVLKKHQFQVKPAEVELGYSHKSKTVSHYLRGLCIEKLSTSDWDPGRAAETLAGDGDNRVIAKLKGKMLRFLANIADNVATGTEDRLYRNLPTAYHDAMDRAIEHARKRQRET